MKLKRKVKTIEGFLIGTANHGVNQYISITEIKEDGRVVGFHSTNVDDMKLMDEYHANKVFDTLVSKANGTRYTLVRVKKFKGANIKSKVDMVKEGFEND